MGDTMPAHYESPPEPTPEKVDNTNAILRAVIEQMAADAGTDVAAVVEQMAAAGKLSAADVDTAAKKGWVTGKRADDLAETVAAVAAAEVE
jgi:hypothetical protein